jgi:hypothetical protein
VEREFTSSDSPWPVETCRRRRYGNNLPALIMAAATPLQVRPPSSSTDLE